MKRPYAQARAERSIFRTARLAAVLLGLGACGNEDHGGAPPWPSGPARACQGRSTLGPPTASLLVDPDAPFEFPPLQREVPLYELEVPEASLRALDRAPREDALYPATFVIEGKRHAVRIRYRGNSSRDWPKKSWRIEFVDGAGFDGRHKLNLLSEWKDSTLMVEKLGYDLLAALHVPAPTAAYVRLQVNGEYRGVHLDLERVDKRFLRAHRFPDGDATIYRCGRKDCELKPWAAPFQKPWEKKTNERQGDLALRLFLEAVEDTPDPRLPALLDDTLELELYLRTVVADALISNNVVEDSRSYLIRDRHLGRWHYVPWDLNNSSTRLQPGSRVGAVARADHPLFPYGITDGWSEEAYRRRLDEEPAYDWHPLFSNLTTRIALHPELRERLLDRLECALATVFVPAVLGERIAAIEALLAPWIPGDEQVDPEKFADGPRYLLDYASRRAAFLRDEVARFRSPAPGVRLEVVDPAAGRVTIRNRGSDPVELDGWTLTTDARRRPRPNLAGSLAPGESLALDLARHGLGPGRGELGLWHGPALDDVADLVYAGGLAPGERLVRADDGAEWRVAR